MKTCPKCGKIYGDQDINFCLNDGELLEVSTAESLHQNRPFGYADDPPPTVMMNDPRSTNPSAWNAPDPLQPWQSSTPTPPNARRNLGVPLASRDQTLPIISMVLSILSLFMVCCFGGIWLGLPAAIVGFIGMRNADSDPTRYTGRGLAIAGMVIGIVTFLASVVFAIIQALAS